MESEDLQAHLSVSRTGSRETLTEFETRPRLLTNKVPPLEGFVQPSMSPNQGRRNEAPYLPTTTDEIPQMDDQRTDGGNMNFQDYTDRNDDEIKQLHAIMHMATNASPDIWGEVEHYW